MRQVQTVDGVARRVDTPQETAIVPQRYSTFVAPAPQPVTIHTPQLDAMPDTLNVTSPATADVQLRTTYLDRSLGFRTAIMPVAVVTGVLSCVAGVALFSVPILSWVALQTFLAFFCLAWIIGYLAHLLISPDGALFWHTWQLWRTVHSEQKFRQQMYRQRYKDGRL